MILINNLYKLNVRNKLIEDKNFFQNIIPFVKEIAKSEKWRLRAEILDIIPVFSNFINKNSFVEELSDLCFQLLNDPVCEIRKKMSINLVKIFGNMNDKNFNKKLIEKLEEMSHSENYLIRNTVNFVILEFLNDKKNLEFIENNLVDLIINLSKDKVANIRYNSIIIMKKISKLSQNKKINDIIKNRLKELRNDTDIEIIYALNDK
jgi:hypothetical protein